MDDKLLKAHSRGLLSCSAAIRWRPRVRKEGAQTPCLWFHAFLDDVPFAEALLQQPSFCPDRHLPELEMDGHASELLCNPGAPPNLKNRHHPPAGGCRTTGTWTDLQAYPHSNLPVEPSRGGGAELQHYIPAMGPRLPLKKRKVRKSDEDHLWRKEQKFFQPFLRTTAENLAKAAILYEWKLADTGK